ncbi:hypothetical protein ACUN9V_18585 [Salinicola sp. V024]|uniref:hypothetical protein n=1 Tax=Salinicola sp. V024 TaxID=3459609 RepID=UPI004043EC09
MSILVSLLEPILYPSFRKARSESTIVSSNDIEILGRGTVILKEEAIKSRISQINDDDLKEALQKSHRVELSLNEK